MPSRATFRPSPHALLHFPQNRVLVEGTDGEGGGGFCMDAICAFNSVRLRAQIISAPFPQESAAFHTVICFPPVKYVE